MDFGSVQMGGNMSEDTREKYLKIALVVFGVTFLLIYPLGLIWPSGWLWHGGQGAYYFQMICGIYAVLGIYLITKHKGASEYQQSAADLNEDATGLSRP